jgi:hypothetical protein
MFSSMTLIMASCLLHLHVVCICAASAPTISEASFILFLRHPIHAIFTTGSHLAMMAGSLPPTLYALTFLLSMLTPFLGHRKGNRGVVTVTYSQQTLS